MNITQRNNHKFFQQPKNEYIQLYSSRNKENISDNNTDKKHIHIPSKSSSLIKSNFFLIIIKYIKYIIIPLKLIQIILKK